MTYDELDKLQGSELIERRIVVRKQIDAIRQKYLAGAEIEAKALHQEEHLICALLMKFFP